MAYVIQYTIFPAAGGILNDLSHFEESLKAWTNAEGHINTFHGVQVEEEGAKHGYLVSVWASAEQQENFAERFQEKFAQVFNDTPADQVVHRYFAPVKGTAIPALESKNTEFVVITPKVGVSPDKVREIGTKLRDIWDGKGHPTAFHESIKGNSIFLMVAGWDSTAHHLDTVKNEPYVSVVNEFAQVGVFEMSHVNLKKHN